MAVLSISACMTQKRPYSAPSPMARDVAPRPRNRISEFANASKRPSMTIIDRLLRACATGRGCRVLAPSADALNLLFEHRVFLGEQIDRRVLFVWHVAGLVRHVAGPGLTMADRSLRDGTIDGRANGRSLAAALCNSPGRADQSQERHRDDRLFHVTPPVTCSWLRQI